MCIYLISVYLCVCLSLCFSLSICLSLSLFFSICLTFTVYLFIFLPSSLLSSPLLPPPSLPLSDSPLPYKGTFNIFTYDREKIRQKIHPTCLSERMTLFSNKLVQFIFYFSTLLFVFFPSFFYSLFVYAFFFILPAVNVLKQQCALLLPPKNTISPGHGKSAVVGILVPKSA